MSYVTILSIGAILLQVFIGAIKTKSVLFRLFGVLLLLAAAVIQLHQGHYIFGTWLTLGLWWAGYGVFLYWKLARINRRVRNLDMEE